MNFDPSKMPQNRFEGYDDPRFAEKRFCKPCKAVCNAVGSGVRPSIFGNFAEGGAN